MRIFLMRPGGEVEDPRPASRHLSATGRTTVRGVVHRLKLELGTIDLTAIVTAPSPAAIQSAELVAGSLDFLGVVRVMPELVAPTPPDTQLRALLGLGEGLLVVADEPFLSSLGAALAGRPTFPTFVSGQIALLEDRRPFGTWTEGASMKPLLLA
jgi:phosphohistidine phosphatase SixA